MAKGFHADRSAGWGHRSAHFPSGVTQRQFSQQILRVRQELDADIARADESLQNADALHAAAEHLVNDDPSLTLFATDGWHWTVSRFGRSGYLCKELNYYGHGGRQVHAWRVRAALDATLRSLLPQATRRASSQREDFGGQFLTERERGARFLDAYHTPLRQILRFGSRAFGRLIFAGATLLELGLTVVRRGTPAHEAVYLDNVRGYRIVLDHGLDRLRLFAPLVPVHRDGKLAVVAEEAQSISRQFLSEGTAADRIGHLDRIIDQEIKLWLLGVMNQDHSAVLKDVGLIRGSLRFLDAGRFADETAIESDTQAALDEWRRSRNLFLNRTADVRRRRWGPDAAAHYETRMQALTLTHWEDMKDLWGSARDRWSRPADDQRAEAWMEEVEQLRLPPVVRGSHVLTWGIVVLLIVAGVTALTILLNSARLVFP